MKDYVTDINKFQLVHIDRTDEITALISLLKIFHSSSLMQFLNSINTFMIFET